MKKMKSSINSHITTLRDLVHNPTQDIVDGPFGSNLKTSDYVSEGIPVIRLQNISPNKFNPKNLVYVSKDKYENLIRHSYKPGDIVITKLGKPLGEACMIPDEFYEGLIVADIVRLRLNKEKANNKYVQYYLNSSKVNKSLNRHTKGTTRPRVNLNHIRDLPIPIPSLDVQIQTVSRIEELFSLLDASQVSLERARANLRRYRQSLLKAAFSGELTREWRENNISTKNSSPDIADIWEKKRLADICLEINKINPKEEPDREFKYIDISSIDNKEYRVKDPKIFKGKNAPSRARQSIRGNDVLFSSVRTYLKNIALVPVSLEDEVASTGFIIIRTESVQINKFLFYYFLQDSFISQISQLQRGVSYPAIRADDLMSWELYLPKNGEMKIILELLENAFDILEIQNKLIIQNLSREKILKKAILEKAFSGKLVKSI